MKASLTVYLHAFEGRRYSSLLELGSRYLYERELQRLLLQARAMLLEAVGIFRFWFDVTEAGAVAGI